MQLSGILSMFIAEFMKQIQLTRGKVVLVDDEDFPYLNQWNWVANKGNSTWYAVRWGSNNGKKGHVKMHRVILNVPDGLVTDHIDGNGLNNQRKNLRVTTIRQNSLNQGIRRDNTSGYKGVQWRRDRNLWRAIIKVHEKLIHIGNFQKKEQAARAYDEAAIKYFGKFAKLNFPNIRLSAS